MTPRVETNPTPHILSRAEWESAQYGPASALQVNDPAKATTNGYGRILSRDEWEQSQRMSGTQVQSWRIPALPTPTIRRDVTQTPTDAALSGVKGKKIEGLTGVLTRQLVDPVLEHPFQSAAVLGAPFYLPGAAGVAAGAFLAGSAIETIARYGWQQYLASGLSPDARKEFEQDPDRVSGEAAAVQAALLGLGALVHVGSRVTDVSGGMTEAGAAGLRDVGGGRLFSQDVIQGARNADATAQFAGLLESGRQLAVPVDVKAPKGLETTPEPVRAGRVKPVEGLVVPENVKPGRVQPIATEPASAPLEQRAAIDEARRQYESQRITEDTQDIAAQRIADAERVLGLRPEEPTVPQVRRRPGGQKPAPFFETPTGAETLGATAARHGLPEEANPYHPSSPLAPVWEEGHQAATQSYPVFPEGFTMGGQESRIPPDYKPTRPQGFEPTSAPEGATPETAQLAAALKPSRFRGHSTEELVRIARTARQSIEQAQGAIDAAGPAGDVTAERSVTRASGTLAQVEREMALRGVTGDELAKRIAGEQPHAPAGLTPVEGTGETKTRGLAAGVQEKALANKLEMTVGDLPEYRVVSMADQARRAAELIASDPALARRVATGEANAPAGLLPESVFVAVENKAIGEGDVATLRDLATSKRTAEATTMGQRIRALAERDPDSPVAAIQDVVNTRSGGAKNVAKAATATADEVSAIQKHVAAEKIEPKTFLDFLDSLEC